MATRPAQLPFPGLPLSVALSFVVSATALVGCGKADPEADTERSLDEVREAYTDAFRAPPTTRESRELGMTRTPELEAKQADRPVAESALPLVYQVREPGRYRVVEVTGGQAVGGFVGEGGDYVLVEADGVRVGGRPVSGPLAAAGRYAIYYDGPRVADAVIVETTRPEAAEPQVEARPVDVPEIRPATRPADAGVGRLTVTEETED